MSQLRADSLRPLSLILHKVAIFVAVSLIPQYPNILRHSKATKVRIVLQEYDDSIIFEISDNGIGITEEDLSKSTSFGLIGMRERVYPWKGDVLITGDRNKGTTIKIIIPQDSEITERVDTKV